MHSHCWGLPPTWALTVTTFSFKLFLNLMFYRYFCSFVFKNTNWEEFCISWKAETDSARNQIFNLLNATNDQHADVISNLADSLQYMWTINESSIQMHSRFPEFSGHIVFIQCALRIALENRSVVCMCPWFKTDFNQTARDILFFFSRMRELLSIFLIDFVKSTGFL
jgi:hypothetical protein